MEIKEKLSAGGIMRLYCLKIYCSLATDTFEHLDARKQIVVS